MDRLDWQHTYQRQQRDRDPKLLSGGDEKMGKVSRTKWDIDPLEWERTHGRQQRDPDPKQLNGCSQKTREASRTKWDVDPLEWEQSYGTQQRDLDRNQQSGINEEKWKVSRTRWDRDPSCDYTLEKTQMGVGTDMGWDHHSPALHNLYSKEYTTTTSDRDTDPDGEPMEMCEDDEELARKRRQLQEIEEQILLKKAAIAMKTVEPLLQKETLYRTFREEKEKHFAESPVQLESGCSYSKRSAACKGATLKDRVNVILQQRRCFLAKFHSPSDLPLTLRQSVKTDSSLTEWVKSSSLSNKGLRLEDHPLKLRVKALMRQRRQKSCVLPSNGEVPEVKPPPASESPAPVLEKNTISEGFQRFLSVLNKGVDISLLSRIVNDDSEELPDAGHLLNTPPPVLQNKSDTPCRKESQGSHSRALQQDQNRSKSRERRTELPSREAPNTERHPLPEEKPIHRSERRDSHVGSSSRSRSPPSAKGEKPRPEEQQREHLQNVLKTLGLSLEAEEISKLADRTQERLYGKKQDDRQHDNREKERCQRSVHRRHRNSSSSTSTSGSFSPGPSRRQRSPSGDSRDSRERRRTSERSRSRERNKDAETPPDRVWDGKQAARHGDGDMDPVGSQESTPGHYLYQKNPTHPPSHPAALAAVPEYNFTQYSHHSSHNSGTYTAATSSAWFYTHNAMPPPSYPSGYPYQQNASYHFSGPAPTPTPVYPYPHRQPANTFSLEGTHLMLNPDLSASEGQSGQQVGLRCLQVVTTKQMTDQRCIMQLTKSHKKKETSQRRKERRRLSRQKKRSELRKKQVSAMAPMESSLRAEVPESTVGVTGSSLGVQVPESTVGVTGSSVRVQVPESSVGVTGSSLRVQVPESTVATRGSSLTLEVLESTVAAKTETQHSEEDKKQLTEEEIKANLKKKLEAFNKMMKQKATLPAKNSLT